MRHRKWLIPILFAAVAVMLMAVAMTWAVVTGVAVPDQDPTPAMQARFAHHMRIVDSLVLAGLVAFLGALTSVLVLGVQAFRGHRSEA